MLEESIHADHYEDKLLVAAERAFIVTSLCNNPLGIIKISRCLDSEMKLLKSHAQTLQICGDSINKEKIPTFAIHILFLAADALWLGIEKHHACIIFL